MTEKPRNHPIGVAGPFVGTSGIDRLRFGACGDLLDAGAVMVEETGRGRISGMRMLLAVQATRATHTLESIIALCRIGRGAQAAMLSADGLAVVLVLGVAEGAEDDALFGGHDPPNLPTALTGWLDERPVLLVEQ